MKAMGPHAYSAGASFPTASIAGIPRIWKTIMENRQPLGLALQASNIVL
jgi:hypothetical protein